MPVYTSARETELVCKKLFQIRYEGYANDPGDKGVGRLEELKATGCSHLLGKHCGSLPSWLCQSINSQGTDKIRTRTDRRINNVAYQLKDVGGCRRCARNHAALIRLLLALVDRIFCCS